MKAQASAVRVQGLVKRYGDLVAVAGVDLDVPEGVCFGVLGPNGAGKTTTMRTLVGLARPDAGTVEVLGHDALAGPEARARMGIVPQESNLDLEATAFDNLLNYARFFRIPKAEARRKAEELLRFVELDAKRDTVVDQLSGGMKRRLLIARALVNDPELLVLDEPTTGLDPQSRSLLWERVRSLRAQGKTILLTTHYMDEAERLCDELVIMDAGRVIARGRPADLVREHIGREVLEVVSDDPASVQRAAGTRGENTGTSLVFPTEHADQLLARLTESGVKMDSAQARRATLEDVFLHLTGRSLRE